jgi:hypothetical protein
MGIKPALGWLALFLFATTAQAEGSRELGRTPPKTRATQPAPVTPKTKVQVVPVSASTTSSLVVVESARPRSDYEAEIYSGVPLDGDLAKERGLDRGMVFMVFEQARRPAFRRAQAKIRRVIRLAAEDRASALTVTGGPGTTKPAATRPAREHVDVLDTEDGIIVVDTTTHTAGMFTTSDVYVFPRGATLDQRVGLLQTLPAPRPHIREALVVAEWTR